MTFLSYQNFFMKLRSAFQVREQVRRRKGLSQSGSSSLHGVESLEVRMLLTATLVKDIKTTLGSSYGPHCLTDVGGTLFFSEDDGIHGEELWKSDGTTPGTQFVKDINPGTASFNQTGADASFTNVNGLLYFIADDGVHGRELWRSDGTEGGTYLVKDITPGANTIGPTNLVSFNGKLYFEAYDGVHGDELWTSDGTDAGTFLLKDICPGPFGSMGNINYFSGLTLFNNKLYFSASGDPFDAELWVTDGTSDGTTQVIDITGDKNASKPNYLTVSNGSLFFSAYHPQTGNELYKTDGTAAGTTMVKDITPGNSSSGFNIYAMADVNGTLFFTDDDGVHGTELWKSDGTPAGTTMVEDIYPGSWSSLKAFDYYMINLNGVLIFEADDPVNGPSLWKSDGTELGTFNLNSSSSAPNNFITIGKFVYYDAFDIDNGFQIWRTDGTPLGTSLLKTLDPASNAEPYLNEPMEDMDGTLYFSASDTTHAVELWKWDDPDQNHAPVLNAGGNPQLSAVAQGTVSNGTFIKDLISSMNPGGSITDVDQTAAQGIAVTGADTTHGTWQYSLNGGTTWFSLGIVSDNSARLLASDSSTRIRFIPATGYLGSASLTFVAWDQTTSTNGEKTNATVRGGITAFSATPETANVAVLPPNHAPVLNGSGNPTLPTIANNNPGNGVLIGELISTMSPLGSITDADSGASKGIAVIGANNVNGTWQFSLNNGATWGAIGAASVSTARLLAANTTTRIRFLPNAGFGGASGISFVAWDQTSGTNGASQAITATSGTTAFSLNKETASITVTVNHAPVLNASGNPALPTVNINGVNSGSTIDDLITSMGSAGSITDVDAGSIRGIAIIGVNNASGTWQYSLDNGTTWQPVGAASAGNARLLAANGTTKLRFSPNGATFSGNVGVTFVAWDQTAGSNGNTMAIAATGGSTAYSSNKESAFVTVVGNHAPVLNPNGNPTLPSFSSGAQTNGMLIADLLTAMGPTGSITDLDAGASKGIAIIGINNLYGRWEYSLDNGTNWQQVGNSSVGNSRLLAANSTNRIRFVPNTGFKGTVGLTFLAWDRTSGIDGATVSIGTAGGPSAYSTAKENAFVTVTA